MTRAPVCDYCGFLTTDALRKLIADRPAGAPYPARVHGHHLWRLCSVSSVFFVRAPDVETAERFSRYGSRTERTTTKGKNKAKRATYADIALLLGTLDQKPERENA